MRCTLEWPGTVSPPAPNATFPDKSTLTRDSLLTRFFPQLNLLKYSHGPYHVRKSGPARLFVEVPRDRDKGRFLHVQLAKKGILVLNGNFVTCAGINEEKGSKGASLLRDRFLNLNRVPLNDDLILIELIRIRDDLTNSRTLQSGFYESFQVSSPSAYVAVPFCSSP